MGDKSQIEWTQATWNPLAGCTKVSPGCKNCYAIRDAHRMSGNPNEKIHAKYAGTVTEDGRNWTSKINFDESSLALPLRWTRPRRIFVNSMSDLFHANVPDEWIDKIFAVMALAPQHTFQVLTKRPERMREYLGQKAAEWTDLGVSETLKEMGIDCDYCYNQGKVKPHLKAAGWYFDWDPAGEGGELIYDGMTPFPHIWLGVSVENQEEADARIPLLLDTPAAVRWLSCEPLLEIVDLNNYLYTRFEMGGARNNHNKVDWVVAGGESGPKARPSHPDWYRSLRDQCQAAGVPFFFKQWGEYQPVTPLYAGRDDAAENGRGELISLDTDGFIWDKWQPNDLRTWLIEKVGKKHAGRELDGRTWDEMPK